ncbi:hypothetical protein MKX08_003910 [Trichoderma sp. CBMAI-0020]|nr:hypothetical protein MKX08_003910 [Trichoderma sp. CBMAI-0020]
MPARKRSLRGVSTQDAPPPKMAKTSTTNWRDVFEIEIKIPSKKKAYQNDWGPLDPEQLKVNAPDEDSYEHEDEDEEYDENNHDVHHDIDWLEPISGFALSKDIALGKSKPDCIGSCDSVLIRCSRIRRSFHSDIGELYTDTSSMGFDLFDRYGRLKPAFKKGSARCGSGIWGDELDDGDILLIQKVCIDEPHRRQGMAQEMVRDMLQKALAKCNPQTFIAIAREKSGEEQSVIYDRERHKLECFWRSLGFRRIGYTEWFALLPGNAQHVSHNVPANLDFVLSRPTADRMTNAVFTKLLEAFKTIKKDTARFMLTQAALGSYAPENDVWISADRDGNTLLHHAATSENSLCVKWLIGKCPRLASEENALGETPLDAYQEQLEAIRTRQKMAGESIAVSDKFTGYSQPSVEVLCALKGLNHLSLEGLLQLKYGCTCGQCQEGFFSPRMRRALLYNAETTSDMLLSWDNDANGDFFVTEFGRFLKYLPPKMYKEMRSDARLRKGFSSMFGSFAQCLWDNTEPPRELKVVEAVMSESNGSSVAKHYLDCGGTVEAVGSALFWRVMDESQSAGDGATWDCFADDLQALPACRNDDEFGFVSSMCGYARVHQGQCFSATGRPVDECNL